MRKFAIETGCKVQKGQYWRSFGVLLKGIAAAAGTGSCCQSGQGLSLAEEGLAQALV